MTNSLVVSAKSSNVLFTTNTDLHAKRETKLENVACDSVYTDTPFNIVKELLDKEFRSVVHKKCLSMFHSVVDIHSQQRILVDLDSRFVGLFNV